jgi:hypothetical protein
MRANHADIDANYVFRCANPAALKGIETTHLQSFKRLYRLEAQRAAPRPGQAAADAEEPGARLVSSPA